MAVGGALFSNSRGGSGHGSGGKSSLVEFRAGKMTLGADNLVTADKRKGMIIVDQAEDQLMHFQWKDRTSGKIEDDLIIFPDDIEFKKVSQCTTGRVFLLKFKSSNRKMFFWMQEPKTDKDEEYCKKVNDYLNNPPAPGSSSRSGGSGGSSGFGGGGLDLSNLGDAELQSLLNNMNQQQLMQLFGGGNLGGLSALLGSGQSPGSRRERSHGARGNRDTTSSSTSSSATTSQTTTTASTPTTTTASSASSKPATTASGAASGTPASGSAAAIQLSDLQNILSGIQVPGGAEGGSNKVAVDLADGSFTAELMQPLLKNPDFVRRMKDFLPPEHQGDNLANEIQGTVQSPQFQQALSLFSSALQSGQLQSLIREFDLGDEAVAAAAAGDMEAFVKALEKRSKKQSADQPEDMALD